MRPRVALILFVALACDDTSRDVRDHYADVDARSSDDGEARASDSGDADGSDDGEGTTLTFETVLDALPHTFAYEFAEDPLGMGSGAGLTDYDGDGDVDVFLGDSPGGTPACLYRNDSTPGVFAFVPVDSVCERRFSRPVRFAVGVGENGRELLLAGSRFLTFFDPETGESTDLLGGLELDDLRRRCEVSAVREVDLDGDGVVELYVGCGHAPRTTGARENIVFAQQDGRWEAWTTETAGVLANTGATLAIAVVESEEHTSLFLANDSFSSPGQRNVLDVPGVWLDRASEGVWQASPITAGADAYGSFMGAAVLPLDGRPTLIVTDWGPPRSVDLETRAVREFPQAFGWGPIPLFSWSALPFDFDGDGRLDIYLTLGHVQSLGGDADRSHEDRLLLATHNGFRATGRSDLAPSDPNPYRTSRSAVLVDLDGDDVPELFTLPLAGPAVIDRIVSSARPPTCVFDAPRGITTSPELEGVSLDLAAHAAMGAPPEWYARGEHCRTRSQ